MNKNRWILVTALFILSFTLAVPALAKSTVSFHSWMAAEVTSGGISVLQEAEKKFEEMNPDIDIETVPLPYEETPDQLAIMIAAGNPPDITTVDVIWLEQLAAMGGLEPLSGYFSEELLKDLFPSSINLGKAQGDQYALVWNDNPNLLCYNRVLLEKAGFNPDQPPPTMDEFNQAIAAVSGLGGDILGIELNMSKDSFSADYLHPWLWNFGAEVFNPDRKIILNNAAGVEAVEWVNSLVKNKYMDPGLGIREIRVIFAQEKLGFMLEGPWIRGILRGLNPRQEEFDKDWALAPIPKGSAIPDDVPYGYSNPSSHMLVLSKDSKNKEAAWKYMEFLISDTEITKTYYQDTGLMPTRISLLNDPIYKDDPFVRQVLNQTEYMKKPLGWGPRWGRVGEIVMAAVQEVVLMGRDVQSALDEAVRQIDIELSM
ncbi:MAG: sugar ABC transporter substrate-binding protein [Atribacterota bacterium]|jgi:multiple sugar transport system substrate-binding protein|nr:sugar ABC transporter substrate-binding protein [Atribacterota bacterium]